MEAPLKQLDQFYYDPTAPIGRGSYGTVYLAFHQQEKDTKAALKMIPLASIADDDYAYNLLMREIDVLRQLKGDHVVSLLNVKRTVNNLYIFMEYCDGGDLETKMKAGHVFTEDEACSVVKQIAHVFVTLDQQEDIISSRENKMTLMHRDIKPANVMFHQGQVKLADFGFAKIIDDVDKAIRMEHTPLGTPSYTSPQILDFQDYSVKCDVWSSGILLYELLFGVYPWEGYSPYEIYKNIKARPLTFPKAIDNHTKDLLTGMLKFDEADRLSWKEVFDHPALNQSFVL